MIKWFSLHISVNHVWTLTLKEAVLSVRKTLIGIIVGRFLSVVTALDSRRIIGGCCPYILTNKTT
jgi:hypothetical protein